MELKDVISLSLFYRQKNNLFSITPNEVISIGYSAFLQFEKLYRPDLGVKKSTYFMLILEWGIREEFRRHSHVKIPKHAWNKGVRAPIKELNIKSYAKEYKVNHGFEFDRFDALMAECDKLSERERLILFHKYELRGKDKLTYKALAEKLSLSPQRVRMIHQRSIHKLRNRLIEEIGSTPV